MLCLLSRTRVQSIGDPLLNNIADEKRGELDSRPPLAAFGRHLSQHNSYLKLKTMEPLLLPVHKYKASHMLLYLPPKHTRWRLVGQ